MIISLYGLNYQTDFKKIFDNINNIKNMFLLINDPGRFIRACKGNASSILQFATYNIFNVIFF